MKGMRLWIAAGIFLGTAAMATAQAIQVNKENRTIAITADDKASASADVATVSIGFTLYAPDAASAYRQGSQLSNAIIDAVKKAGVADKNIESRAQNLARTEFPFNNQTTPAERAEKQFTLSQSWAVHTAADNAAKILHTAIEAGANDSGNIDWDVADRDALEAKAAGKALLRAHAIAAQMAEGLGVHLGPLLYASNQAPERPTPVRFMAKAALAGVPQQATAPLALAPQQVEESATVYAVFSIQ